MKTKKVILLGIICLSVIFDSNIRNSSTWNKSTVSYGAEV